jgi:hypothetical protein
VLAVPGTAVRVGKLPDGSSAEKIEAMLSQWHDAGPPGMSLRDWAGQPADARSGA